MGPKLGATNPQAPAPAPSDRLSQLKKQVAENRDGTIRDVLEKLRHLSYEIEEINRSVDSFARPAETLDELRVRVYHQEAEIVELRRQVELGSTPSPPLNQQAVKDRFPILIYSGERSALPRFIKLFYTWALSSQSEDALNHSRPIIMTGDNSCRELERQYGIQIVTQSLTVWNALTKAVEKDKTIADIVVGAKATSEAWMILKSMVDDDNSERVREHANKTFEELSMDNMEPINSKSEVYRQLLLRIKILVASISQVTTTHQWHRDKSRSSDSNNNSSPASTQGGSRHFQPPNVSRDETN